MKKKKVDQRSVAFSEEKGKSWDQKGQDEPGRRDGGNLGRGGRGTVEKTFIIIWGEATPCLGSLDLTIRLIRDPLCLRLAGARGIWKGGDRRLGRGLARGGNRGGSGGGPGGVGVRSRGKSGFT